MNPRRIGLLVEFLLLFGALPVALRLGLFPLHPFILLWIVSAICVAVLLRSPDFDRRQLWDARRLPRRLAWALLPFAVLAPLIALAVVVLEPARAFRFVHEQPLMWALVMLLYPILSVYPQGVVYRVFLSHRYRTLFTSPAVRVLASAVAFSLIHIIYENWLAPTLSLVGGVFFAWTYEETRSSLVAAIQHAAFGSWLFTTGLGWYFYYSGQVG